MATQDGNTDDSTTSDVNPNDDICNGFEFIRKFLVNQKLNDYLNAAIDEAENSEKGNVISDEETSECDENINLNDR